MQELPSHLAGNCCAGGGRKSRASSHVAADLPLEGPPLYNARCLHCVGKEGLQAGLEGRTFGRSGSTGGASGTPGGERKEEAGAEKDPEPTDPQH